MSALENSQYPDNPYRALQGDTLGAPFAGRQKAFEHLYQQLTGGKTSVILGRRDSGKTAVLRQFSAYFDTAFMGAYLSLKDNPLPSEAEWLVALSEATMTMMIERNLSLSRLVYLHADKEHIRQWLSETFFPTVFKVLHDNHLVLLIDDAGALVKALRSGSLPPDTFNFLGTLIEQQPNLGFVLAMDSRYEDAIPGLSPLIGLTDVLRLENLSQDEAAWLLRKPVEGRYSVNDEAVTAVYRATGGEPRLLQRYGAALYHLWETRSETSTLTAEDVKSLTQPVYEQSQGDFRQIWDEMGRNERLVMRAISQLHYADPLASINADRIQHWLLESDFPLDITAVHAALRALEYDERITQTADEIHIKAGLHQRWLLEYGRLNDMPIPNRTRLLWVAIGVLALSALLLAILAGQRSPGPSHLDAAPTLTLVMTATP